ncbi:unnamed protein product [Phytophthora lilii]|uniref:Unnamed protein product n=1 Tax=Phytophthora lilii TaxID=2077276 RepID=A0A9W6U3B3_9STRA|nr:unnamed protein product [Phytophthora lilii]
MLATGPKVAAVAAAVAAYLRPQLMLQPLIGAELDGADADASVRVLRGLLTLLSYALASTRPSWFWALVALAALQLTLWGLQLAEDSLLGLSVEAEKKLFLVGAVLCFAAIVSIILFGGKGDAKARFRCVRLVAFYTKHNPEKLPQVDELVRKYEFNEELLFQRLHRKYNALAAGADTRSVMKNIDESEFLYEEEEEERLESEETAPLLQEKSTKAQPQNETDSDEFEEPESSFSPEKSAGSSESAESFEVVEKTVAAPVPAIRPLEIEDYDLLDGTPPVSPRTAERLAHTHRQSSTLINDAIKLARREQQQRIERRVANIASKCGDGYAGH